MLYNVFCYFHIFLSLLTYLFITTLQCCQNAYNYSSEVFWYCLFWIRRAPILAGHFLHYDDLTGHAMLMSNNVGCADSGGQVGGQPLGNHWATTGHREK